MQQMLDQITELLKDKGYLMDPSGVAALPFYAVIAILAVSVLFGFLGLKLVKLFLVLVGAIAGGVAAGAIYYYGPNLNQIIMAIIALGAIILGAAIFTAVPRLGAFFAGLLVGAGLAAAILQPRDWMMLAVCLGIGLVAAILAAILYNPLIIILTALGGGLLAGQCLAVLLQHGNNSLVVLGLGGGLSIAGLVVQFLLYSRKVAKKEHVFQKKNKETSREKEVEMARGVLDDEEEAEDEITYLDADDK